MYLSVSFTQAVLKGFNLRRKMVTKEGNKINANNVGSDFLNCFKCPIVNIMLKSIIDPKESVEHLID